jgi:hypothetical protein
MAKKKITGAEDFLRKLSGMVILLKNFVLPASPSEALLPTPPSGVISGVGGRFY